MLKIENNSINFKSTYNININIIFYNNMNKKHKLETQNGAIGFLTPEIPTGLIKIFYLNTVQEIENYYENAMDCFGEDILCKFVEVENASVIFQKLKEQIKNYQVMKELDDLFCCSPAELLKNIKEIRGNVKTENYRNIKRRNN